MAAPVVIGRRSTASVMNGTIRAIPALPAAPGAMCRVVVVSCCQLAGRSADITNDDTLRVRRAAVGMLIVITIPGHPLSVVVTCRAAGVTGRRATE